VERTESHIFILKVFAVFPAKLETRTKGPHQAWRLINCRVLRSEDAPEGKVQHDEVEDSSYTYFIN